jgi:GGDEF domain-containing protein
MAAAARLLKEHTRWTDIIGRWDGWEFLLVLPETNQEAATQLVGKLEGFLSGEPTTGTEICFRARFGVTEWRRGDDALFMLKRVRAAPGSGGLAEGEETP